MTSKSITETIEIVVEESDLREMVSKREEKLLDAEKVEPVLKTGELPKKVRIIMQAVPKVIAKLIVQAEPDGYRASSFKLNVKFSGELFGVGVSAISEVTYERNE